MAELTALKLCGQGTALACLTLKSRGLCGELLQFALHRLQVFIDRVFKQAELIALEDFAGGGELHPVEHRVLVRELVDGRLLVADLVQQSLGQLAPLRGCQVIELGFVDHENAFCPLQRQQASALQAISLKHADDSGLTHHLPGKPSTSASSCTRLSVSVPSTLWGQMNLPRCSRLAASQMPIPSCTSTFIRLALRLAKRYAVRGCVAPKTFTTRASVDSVPARMSSGSTAIPTESMRINAATRVASANTQSWQIVASSRSPPTAPVEVRCALRRRARLEPWPAG